MSSSSASGKKLTSHWHSSLWPHLPTGLWGLGLQLWSGGRHVVPSEPQGGRSGWLGCSVGGLWGGLVFSLESSQPCSHFGFRPWKQITWKFSGTTRKLTANWFRAGCGQKGQDCEERQSCGSKISQQIF